MSMLRKTAIAAACLTLSACAVPVGPVEVARFHLPDTAGLGHGTIAVTAGPGMAQGDLELQTYETAVERKLGALGYSPASPDQAEQIAQIRIARSEIDDGVNTTHVGVSAAGSTHASAMGIGVAIPIGPRNARRTATDLAMVIRDRASGKVLWEGRASFTVSSTSPLAQTALAAPKLAEALLSNFPGDSGQTVLVR